MGGANMGRGLMTGWAGPRRGGAEPSGGRGGRAYRRPPAPDSAAAGEIPRPPLRGGTERDRAEPQTRPSLLDFRGNFPRLHFSESFGKSPRTF